MNYKEIVDELVADCDERTSFLMEEIKGEKKLALWGDETAPFLRALKRKAEKFGFDVVVKRELHNYVPVDDVERPSVYDTEAFDIICPVPTRDIDPSDCPAVAEGVRDIIEEIGVREKDVCIVGRGRSVSGLGYFLLRNDNTVTICHSKTSPRAMQEHFFNADVVVLGTPQLPEFPNGVIFYNAELIIDIGGALDQEIVKDWDNYLGPRDIGRLCTSILCDRAARWYL